MCLRGDDGWPFGHGRSTANAMRIHPFIIVTRGQIGWRHDLRPPVPFADGERNEHSHGGGCAHAAFARHPRWTFHFVPTSCSWRNAVDGFFAKLTRRRLKHGVFHSVVDLQASINRFIKEHNQDPRPFIWRADPDEIIAAVRRGHQTLESIH